MMTIPWRSTDSTEPATVVQVSRLELAHARDIPRFLIAALRIRRATLRSPGAVGVSLRAAPATRTFWTLSSWTNEAAIRKFVVSEVHMAVMKGYRDRMAGSHFHTWTEKEATGVPPTWDDAMRRYETSVGPVSSRR